MPKSKMPGMKAAIKVEKQHGKPGWTDLLIRDPFSNAKLTSDLAHKAYSQGKTIDTIRPATPQTLQSPLDCKLNLAENFPAETKREIISARHTAKRFYFDADASFRIGDMMQHNMMFVANNMPGVHFPYDPLYIVLDERKIWEGRGGKTSDKDYKILSFLIMNGVVKTLAGDGDNCDLDILEFTYNAYQTPIHGVTTKTLDLVRKAYIYGGRYRKGSDFILLIPDTCNPKLRVNVFLNANYGIEEEGQNSLLNLAVNYGGAPLICLAALMMLNSQHEVVKRDHVPAARTMVKGGKSVALPEYHAVHIVDGKRAVSTRTIMRSGVIDRRPAREHDVRGHFAHFGTKSECNHVWEPMDVFGKRYRCKDCGLRRTWRTDFKRGDASLGRIDKHYEIHEAEKP